MSLSIQKIRPASTKEWDAIWRKCDYSTYFHSREWAEIWNVYTSGFIRPEPKMVIFSDDKKALLPLAVKESHMGIIKTYLSSPALTFGGWLSSDKLGVTHALLMVEYLTGKLGNITWRLNPYDELVFKADVRGTTHEVTHTINLSEGFDVAYDRWSKAKQRAVRKALKNRVSVKTASTLEDWKEYYRVYKDSLRRWNDKTSPAYRWELFEEMFRRKSPNIKLWLAVHEEKVVAGDLLFYAKNHVVDWHAAALKDYFHLKPTVLIVYEALRDACERGYTWFDLNPSGELEGTRVFKEELGTEVLKCPVLHTRGISILKRLVRV